MNVLVAMSGGVDSSVAAALLLEAGHDVTGVTMKLWGGESDTGCCSVSDVDDARRVAQQLEIDHHVFNFGDDFAAHVVDPYVRDHARGITPNPCIGCNRRLKFGRLLRRADALGFDAVATGHHARIVDHTAGRRRVARGADSTKDQSYVLYMLGTDELARVLLPVGDLTKAQVRRRAEVLGLRTADKPDSQDVCFITRADGRTAFLGDRIELRPGRVVDTSGEAVGAVDAVELVTVGQRRGLGSSGLGTPRYAVDVDVAGATVTVGSADELLVDETDVIAIAGVEPKVSGEVLAQCSAHGEPRPARLVPGARSASGRSARLRWATPRPRVAPGQSVVFYEGDQVLAGGLAR